MNEFFIFLDDITLSLGYLRGEDGEVSKCLLSPLDQKTFQELVFKAVKNRKRSGLIANIAGQID